MEEVENVTEREEAEEEEDNVINFTNSKKNFQVTDNK